MRRLAIKERWQRREKVEVEVKEAKEENGRHTHRDTIIAQISTYEVKGT